MSSTDSGKYRLITNPRCKACRKNTGPVLTQRARGAMDVLDSLVVELIGVQRQRVRDLYDDERAQDALAAISEGGEYGVEAVGGRIAGRAAELCGDNKTRLTEMKAAVNRGFSRAADATGGGLPDLCMQTYREIMKRLDRWSQD